MPSPRELFEGFLAAWCIAWGIIGGSIALKILWDLTFG